MSDGKRVEVFLVPGFLGFESLGGLDYFIGVQPKLENTLRALGLEPHVYRTEPRPTASFYQRAQKLADEVAKHHSMDAASVHFVGHSTGGLDIRMLLSPKSAIERELVAKAEEGDDSARLVLDALQKTESAVSVATPHFGTPIASLALRLDVDWILRGGGKVLELDPIAEALAQALQVTGLVSAIAGGLLPKKSLLKWIGDEVFSAPPEELVRYVRSVTADAGALRNLTQAGTNLANALLIDRPGVRYGSIITGTQKPRGLVKAKDPFIFFNTLIFRLGWRIVSTEHKGFPYAERNDELTSFHRQDLDKGEDVGELFIDNDVNDGVVPTASQPHGEILGVFASDHLDCVGHFPHEGFRGWVRSGAKFRDARFDLLWQRVSRFVANQPVRSRPVTASPQLRPPLS